MDERRNRENDRPVRRDMDRAAIERRRAALKARRRKQMQMRILVLGTMALIVILVIVLLVLGISAIFKDRGNSGKKTPATQTEAPSEAPSAEPTPTPEAGPLQEKPEITPVEDITSLSNENIGWGYGPSRDDQNRPMDAVSYQEKYGSYGAYFVRTSIGEDKVIYLTSDEGYENGCTPAILDALAETNTKIVFFVTKPFVEGNPELVQRMIDEGHIVGSHSVTHPSDGMPSLSIEQQQNEITELHQYVKDNFNYDMWLFRPPTGKFSEQSLAVANNLNYRSVFWSFAYLDYDVENQPDEAEALQKCLNSLHPGAIYLLHAVSQTNTNILKDFINGAKDQGYRFELLPANGF